MHMIFPHDLTRFTPVRSRQASEYSILCLKLCFHSVLILQFSLWLSSRSEKKNKPAGLDSWIISGSSFASQSRTSASVFLSDLFCEFNYQAADCGSVKPAGHIIPPDSRCNVLCPKQYIQLPHAASATWLELISFMLGGSELHGCNSMTSQWSYYVTWVEHLTRPNSAGLRGSAAKDMKARKKQKLYFF